MTKKILITGKNSYIGTSFIEYCKKNNVDFEIDELSVRGDDWKKEDFSKYDVVFHVAGIAHNSSDSSLEDLYYEVNRDLTVAVANKAKQDGIKQFIFMSSIIVYGTQNEVIDEHTAPNPDNFYGDSKLQAEKGIKHLNSDDFKVVILRPPMIYGKGSKGNYPRLSKLAQITPIFPKFENKRSMLHTDNLIELIRLIIFNEDSGIFHPQNKQYVKTSDMVKAISEVYDRKMFQTRLFNPAIYFLRRFILLNKVFGNLYYDYKISFYDKGNYNIRDFRESIKITESEER